VLRNVYVPDVPVVGAGRGQGAGVTERGQTLPTASSVAAVGERIQ